MAKANRYHALTVAKFILSLNLNLIFGLHKIDEHNLYLSELDSDLIDAIESKDSLKAIKMLDNGANIDCHEPEAGFTPLMLAISENNTEIVQLLLERNSNVNETDKKGNTALMMAVEMNHIDFIKLLLNAYCDLTVLNKDFVIAFHIADKMGNKKISSLLANEPTRRMLAHSRRYEINKLLLKYYFYDIKTIIESYLPKELLEYEDFLFRGKKEIQQRRLFIKEIINQILEALPIIEIIISYLPDQADEYLEFLKNIEESQKNDFKKSSSEDKKIKSNNCCVIF